MATLYDKDFYDWTQEQAKLLRSGQLSSADVEHIAEEKGLADFFLDIVFEIHYYAQHRNTLFNRLTSKSLALQVDAINSLSW